MRHMIRKHIPSSMNKYNSTAVRYYVDTQELLRIARHKTSRNRLLLLISKWKDLQNVWQKFKFNSLMCNFLIKYFITCTCVADIHSQWTAHIQYVHVYVACNLRICPISRLCCTFSESWDCITHVHNLKIAWFVCAMYIYELSCCNAWQWVICHDCVACRMKDILDKCRLPP